MNFAILTAGNIAGQMAATIEKMPDVTGYAIAARDLQRADEMRKKYDFKKAFGSYDELFADEAVDIIYIASTHDLHFAHAKAALEAGKHVLCEKPVTANAAQAKELIELAKSKQLVFCDATWTRYMPFVDALKAVLLNGDIGEVHMLECSFGFPSFTVPRMASPERCGGALLDLGVYPLTMARIALGLGEAEIDGVCVKTEQGVDAKNAFTLKYKNGKLAVLQSCMMTTLSNQAIIYGTHGRIEIPQFWKADSFSIYDQKNMKTEYSFPHEISGYEYEVRSLISAIKNRRLECDELPHEETIKVMEFMDTLRQKWDIKYPCENSNR